MYALQKPSFITTLILVCLFAIAPLIIVLNQSGFANATTLLSSYQYWLFVLFYVGIYFLLHSFIVPYLYAVKKWLLFSVAILMLLAATIIIKPFDSIVHFSRKDNSPQEQLIKQGDKPFGGSGRYPFRKSGRMKGPFGPVFDIVSVFLLGMVLLVVIADAAVKKANFTEQRALQAEAERIKAELSFLKAQINPHFLFNTLNNIYSLAVTKSEHTAHAVMMLSNIMRYVTDGANETWAPLQDEKECIADYISLQKLRLGQNFPVQFLVSGDIDRKTIPPLSLMTFVENAFKHGISNHEQNSITFKILAQDKYIHFSATNKLFLTERNTERTGIGIENTKKRLQVLYPEKHVLNIDAKDGFYTVDLILYS